MPADSAPVLHGSGVQVGNELAFQALDEVFEIELALFQATQLQLVDVGLRLETDNGVIEIAVLQAQRGEARFEGFDFLCFHGLRMKPGAKEHKTRGFPRTRARFSGICRN